MFSLGAAAMRASSLLERLAADSLSLPGEKRPFCISEPDSFAAESFLQQTILGLKELDDDQLLPMAPQIRPSTRKKLRSGSTEPMPKVCPRLQANFWTGRAPTRRRGRPGSLAQRNAVLQGVLGGIDRSTSAHQAASAPYAHSIVNSFGKLLFGLMLAS